MALTLVTPPAAEVVSLADIKAHLRIDTTLEDATLLRYLQAAREDLEGKDGWLNRALITQTWDWTLDGFPGDEGWWSDSCRGEMKVPLPPLQSITSITYLDSAGVSQVLATTEYEVDTKSEPGRIRPAYGKSWPSTRSNTMNVVTVRLVAGYGAGAASVPTRIRIALLGMVGDTYEHRDIDGSVPAWVQQYLASYRVWI